MALRSVQAWLDEYGESHRNPTNKLIHWICVPVIVFSVVGLLWSLPVPEAFARISPAMNWAVLFAMAATVYYFILSASLAVGMVGILAGMLALAHWLSGLSTPLWAISVGIFVIAWVGQFIGHHILQGPAVPDDRAGVASGLRLPPAGDPLLNPERD